MSDSRTVYRHAVPVDGAWHKIRLTGPFLHVDCRDSRVVEIWTLHNECETGVEREFQVFGTGQQLPDDAGRHVGTALSPDMTPFGRRGALVWHVFEKRMGNR